MLTSNHFDIYRQYENLANSKKLVILHPSAYSVHRMFTAKILDNHQAAYVQLAYNNRDFENSVETLRQALAQQLDLHITIHSDDPSIISQALASALNSLPSSVLFIDNYDPHASPLDDVILALIPQLKDGQRVILSSRSFPKIFLEKFIEERLVAVLPIDKDRLLIDYSNRQDGNDILEVRAFGQGLVLVNGASIENWEGILPRALFFYFIDRGMATRNEVFKTFWPQLGQQEATNVFHVTKRKISEILKIHPTTYSSGFYRISPDVNLYYDVINFREALQNTVIADDDEAEELFQIAVDLYQDDFLSTSDYDWVIKRRDEMKNNYTDALVGLARIHERRNNLEESLGLFQRGLATSPLREDLVRSIMSIQAELGHLDHAEEAYFSFEALLADTLNVAPDPQTTELMKNIRG